MQFRYIQYSNNTLAIEIEKMSYEIIVLALALTIHSIEMNSMKTVNVLIPKIEQISGHYNQKQLLHKLTFKIMENFSKKFKFNVEFVFTNETLHEILENEEHLKNTSQL